MPEEELLLSLTILAAVFCVCVFYLRINDTFCEPCFKDLRLLVQFPNTGKSEPGEKYKNGKELTSERVQNKECYGVFMYEEKSLPVNI